MSWDQRRAIVGFVAAPAAAAVVVAAGDGGVGSRLGAIFAATAVLWITEAVPPAVTALAACCACIAAGVTTSKEAFAAFGNPILFLFVGSFMIAEAMSVHGLGARFARAVAKRARGSLGVLVATSSAAFVLSMWTSNAAATALVLPIAVATARSLDDKRVQAALVVAVAWGASMGGLATPVGTPPNLIGMRALTDHGEALSFFGWMKIGLPLGVAMLFAMWCVLWLVFLRTARTNATTLSAAAADDDDAREPWTRGERIAAFVFVLAVVLWIAPGVLEALGSPYAKPLHEHMPEEVVALGCAVILFVTRALTWEDAARIDWGTVLLFGGGVLLGDLANKTGLAATWGHTLVDVTGASTPLAVIALVAGASLILSELASNTASATLMVPLAFGLATSTHTPPAPAVLAAAIGSSFGFMMPISTAPNAMAYATGLVSIRQMLVAGIVFDVVGYIVVVIALTWVG